MDIASIQENFWANIFKTFFDAIIIENVSCSARLWCCWERDSWYYTKKTNDS